MEQLPLLGMGTWGIGGAFEADTTKDEEGVRALRYGMDQGLLLIDTAEFYGKGHTEELVGRAISGRPRENIRIISKVWKTNLLHDDVVAAAKRSLARLGTDYIDLYLIHWPNPEIPLKETMLAMEELVDRGMVRAIGASNFDDALLEEAVSYLDHTAFFADQVEYNIMQREAEKTIIPYAKAHNIHMIAYRPLAKGKLLEQAGSPLLDLSLKYGKTPNQIALNWITSQGITAIPKATKPEHIKENAGVLGWSLEASDIEHLNKAFS